MEPKIILSVTDKGVFIKAVQGETEIDLSGLFTIDMESSLNYNDNILLSTCRVKMQTR